MKTVCVIESITNGVRTKVSIISADKDMIPIIKQSIKAQSFWDVVGDSMMSFLSGIGQDTKADIFFLIPGMTHQPSNYYSNQTLIRLFEMEKSKGRREFFILDAGNTIHDYGIPKYCSMDWNSLIQNILKEDDRYE